MIFNGFITKKNQAEIHKHIEKCSFSESLNICCISHSCFTCIFTGYLEILIKKNGVSKFTPQLSRISGRHIWETERTLLLLALILLLLLLIVAAL
jgi:hypothetical protein